MKRPIALLIAATVVILSCDSITQAELQLRVANPPTSPLEPGHSLTLQIVGVDPVPVNATLYLLVQGPGHIDGHTMVYPGDLSSYDDDLIIYTGPRSTQEELLAELMATTGYDNIRDSAAAILADSSPTPPPLTGLLIDDIIFTCDSTGWANVIMLDEALLQLHVMPIQQIPEPATALLLTTGILLARKRPINPTFSLQ